MARYNYLILSNLETWFLRRICMKIVDHPNREYGITYYYRVMNEYVTSVCNEDNRPTSDDYLSELHTHASNLVWEMIDLSYQKRQAERLIEQAELRDK